MQYPRGGGAERANSGHGYDARGPVGRIFEVRVTSIDRTAYPTFKRMASRDLADAFTPSDDEIEWARDKSSTDAHLLALMMWLKSYRRLGYFPKLEDVPDAVVEHVRDALNLPASVAAEVDAVRTAKRQRDLVRKRLGVKTTPHRRGASPRRRSSRPPRLRTTRLT
ncbi:hypothetical protein GCM10009525_47610 [Streptosporangium amethystogenes subsp. fukuiense]